MKNGELETVLHFFNPLVYSVSHKKYKQYQKIWCRADNYTLSYTEGNEIATIPLRHE
jgi:hypothetical protein